jgi:acetoacetyl-CoA synthetase
LGLDVRAIDGDLVCANPFPSRPLGFLNDDDSSRFRATYFSQHADVWTHGDLIEFTSHGGAILHGRSDGVLNIRGVRIGPADIYHLLQGVPDVIEAMAVEQHDEREPGGNRLILLVVSKKPIDAALRAQIRQHLITHGTAVMVPAEIIQVAELPVTHNGKRSEAAARDAVNGRAVRNREALRNPECLEAVRAFRHGEPMIWPQQEGEVVEEWLERLCCAMLGQSHIDWSIDLLQFGDSLKFLNLQLELERLLDRDLPWLNETPTIARLAALIRDEKSEPPPNSKDHVTIRPATLADEAEVCQLLTTGFPEIRPANLWHRLFNYPWRLQPPPTYGFVLSVEDKVVGYLGALYAEREINGQRGLICNLTSWYIDPQYRGWGSAMVDAMFEFDNKASYKTTYTALTAAPLPKEIFKQMDFVDACEQSLILVPLSHLKTLSHRPRIIFDPKEIRPHLTADEQRLLDDHIDTDCLHVLVRDRQQTCYMMVKRRTYQVRAWSPWLAASKVLYCSNPELVALHLERVKLAILLRQGTMALVMLARWFSTPPAGMATESHMLIRSSMFTPRDLDSLYSELCLLPV